MIGRRVIGLSDISHNYEGLRYHWPLNSKTLGENIASDTRGAANFPNTGITTENGLNVPAASMMTASGLSGINILTISMWIRPQTLSGLKWVFNLARSAVTVISTTTAHTLLRINGSYFNRYQGAATGMASWTEILVNTTNFPSGTWRHVAVQVHPGMRLFARGANRGHIAQNGNQDTSFPTHLNLGTTDSVQHTGAIFYKDIRIYNRHLTENEIREINDKGPF